MNRAEEFLQIRRSIAPWLLSETTRSLSAIGDAEQILENMPDNSVSLVVCDPPYHSTQKQTIYGDTSFRKDADYLDWITKFAVQWQRILKMNGTLYLFCSSQMMSRIEVRLAEHFRPLNNITWTKPNQPGYDGWKGKMNKSALRHWYPHSERILMFEQGAYGNPTSAKRSVFGEFLKGTRLTAGLSSYELAEQLGAYGTVNHGGSVSNWETGRHIPSREYYNRIVSILEATGKIDTMPEYEDVIRPMNLSKDIEYTDVWNFESVRPFKGKHPAEKPHRLLTHIIGASSYPDDVVLDCFAGSGSTGAAAIELGRRAICIDIDPQWANRLTVAIQGA